jgi:probable HAF family extracellular repeat protein
MKSTSLICRTLALAIGAAVVVSPAFAASYGITDFGALPSSAGGCAANDAGQVVGMLPNGHAFVYTPGVGAADIGTLGGDTIALAINRGGQVAGHGSVNGVEQAFLYTPGIGMVDLGKCVPALVSINQSGQVAGQSARPQLGCAFVYTPGSGTAYVSVPDGNCYAAAINDSGQVVGQYTSPAINNNIHPFFWDPTSGMIDLGTLGAGGGSAWAVNNAGQVAGTSMYADGTGSAFLYTPGLGMIGVGGLGAQCGVHGINSSAQIIGSAGVAAAQRGIVYSAGFGWTQLDPLPGFTSSTTLHISDSGYIIGVSSDASGAQHVVRWDVVPEPSSLLVLSAGLVSARALLRRRRRR